jgi:hypothetical protein
MKNLVHRSLLSLALAALAVAPLRAEVLLLKTGGRIEGELLNPQRSTGDAYHLRTPRGVTLALASDQVSRLVVVSDIQKQYDALLPKVPNTAEGHWKMSQWCREAGLTEQRRFQLSEVIRLDPDHEEARRALGYSQFGGRWMTTEENMESRGYVRYKGSWRLPQEVQLAERDDALELAQKDWRRKLKIWIDQLDRRKAEEALANIRAIRDPAAAPALAEILGEANNPRALRLLCLDILQMLPPGMATRTLIQLSMDDPDGTVRDRCLEELRRGGGLAAIPVYLKALQNKKSNSIVNRAALCLERVAEPDVTPALIDALITEHTVTVGQNTGGGTPINFNAGGGGSGNNGGLGGMSMGGKPKVIKQKFKNPAVHSALTSLNPGANFLYDQEAWRDWYSQNKTSTLVDLRRGE